jgi:hypothetical protein
MKNLFTWICTATLMLAAYNIQAQNTFPSTGNVGIGTTTPEHLLDINSPDGYAKIGLGNGIIYNGFAGIGFGKDIFINNTTGDENTSFGFQALKTNITGSSNVAVGYTAMENNLSGAYNVSLGAYNLVYNTIGEDNVAIGAFSMIQNSKGSYNVAVGSHSMGSNLSANYNTALGFNSMYENIKGNENTAIGYFSLYNNSKGNYNTSIGVLSLNTNTIGSYNTGLGYDADVSATALTNATALGYLALVDASNKVRIGNASVSSNGGQVEWTAYSDARVKTKIEENVPGLEFINLLKPVTYHFDVDKQNELMGVNSKERVEGMYDIEKIQWTGFLAQDVEAAAKKINYDFSGIDKSGELMGLRYSSFVMPIVKSIQELDDRDERQEERVKYLEEENTALTNRIEKLEKIINRQGVVLNDATEEIYKQSAIIENETVVATLSQNIPNPFTGNTSIAYYVPETAQQAHIKIANATGVALFMAEVRLGNGVLEVDATQLAAGTYSYTLVVDGKVVDTKLMVIL